MKTARMASSHSSRLAVTNRTLRSTEMVSESGVVGGGAAGGEAMSSLARNDCYRQKTRSKAKDF